MVYIGSLAGKLVTPFMGPYCVAKAALAAYVDAVRLEMVPRGAHVLLVSPGPIRRDGYVDDYRGIRISKSGRRFRIEQAIVWNLIDAAGHLHGQAATFDAWTPLPPVAKQRWEP